MGPLILRLPLNCNLGRHYLNIRTGFSSSRWKKGFLHRRQLKPMLSTQMGSDKQANRFASIRGKYFFLGI